MQTFDILPDPSFNPSEICRGVEEVCAAQGLTATLIGTTKSCPGSTHWHFKKGNEQGVLEITWWPAQNRLWLSTRPGREGSWTAETFRQIGSKLLERFGGEPEKR